MTEYAVMGKTHEGNVLMLRRGFKSMEDAESHPVKLSLWKLVWIEKVKKRQTHQALQYAPLPWSVEWVHTFTYVRDADGHRVLSLFGSAQRRALIENVLRKAGLLGAA